MLTNLDPGAANAGDYLTIHGRGFGGERGESYVTVAGVAPTVSSYREWTDESITIRLPEFGDSGLLYVHKSTSKTTVKSNPLIFLSSAGVPRLVRAARTDMPVISGVTPPDGGFSGTAVTIRGGGFGGSRGKRAFSSAVKFTAETGTIGPDENAGGYESWKEREITVRIPDGLGDCFLSVVTEKGESAAYPFTVRYQGGAKRLHSKRTYLIMYTADIKIEEAAGGSLYLWVPKPETTAAQQPREITSSAAPFLDEYRGFSLFKFSGLTNNEKRRLVTEAIVDVFAVETALDAAAVSTAPPSGPEKKYLEESPLVPSSNKAVKDEAARITGTERAPYRQAFLIYTALRKEYRLRFETQTGGGALTALKTKEADSYAASLLFCALLRAGGVAARPVAGVLIDRDNNAWPHFWAQFYIENFGWVPADPVMGAERAPAAWVVRADAAAFYFGSLDNQRIIFSLGETPLTKIDRQGRTAGFERGFSFQPFSEEASGALAAWSSARSGVIINGAY